MRTTKRLFALVLVTGALAFGGVTPASANVHITTAYNDLRAD
ncbi:hypothetical protein ACFY9F_29460 [Streptomyces sp. NPDC012421]